MRDSTSTDRPSPDDVRRMADAILARYGVPPVPANPGAIVPRRSTLRGRIALGDVAASCPIGTALRNEAGETVGSTVADIVMVDDATQIWEYVGTPADIEAVRKAAMAQSDRTNVLIPLDNPSEVARLRALALEILEDNEALCLQAVHQHLLGPEEAARRLAEIREACEAKRREIRGEPLKAPVLNGSDSRRYEAIDWDGFDWAQIDGVCCDDVRPGDMAKIIWQSPNPGSSGCGFFLEAGEAIGRWQPIRRDGERAYRAASAESDSKADEPALLPKGDR